jgi:hypothetical protein
MGFDRALGRAQHVGDLLVGLAANNQLEDFALARGQFRDMSAHNVQLVLHATRRLMMRFCCVGLFLTGDNEPLFLQVKQAQNSVLERLGGKLGYKGHQGRRVVQGQQMMQAASDIFLGYTQDEDSGRQFYVRTLKNRRLGGVSEITEGEAFSDYARLCGRTLARAHARSGDPAAIAGYSGKSEVLDDAIASFAMAYADQTILDHAALVKAKNPAKSAKTAKAA